MHGVGLHGLGGVDAIDCGNAGTGMRLMAGALAGQSFDSVLTGDASLSARPMARVIDPLQRMGARIDASEGGRPPLRIRGGQSLQGIDYALPVASAQVKSALLLAGLYARGDTTVREPHPTRDYTERMLAAFGWPIEFAPGHATLGGGHALRAAEVQVPADFSSAAFFIVAATVVPGSEVRLPAVGMNPRRTGLLHALRVMGADITEHQARTSGGEPVADLHRAPRAAARHRGARGVGAGHDRRVPGAVRGRRRRERTHRRARRGRASGEGIRPHRGDGRRPARAGRIGAGVARRRDDPGRYSGFPARRGAKDRQPRRPPHRDGAGRRRAAAPTWRCVIEDVANVATSFPGFVALAVGAGLGLREIGPA